MDKLKIIIVLSVLAIASLTIAANGCPWLNKDDDDKIISGSSIGIGAWTPMATSGGFPGRDLHSAIWTGTEMIVWGGRGGGPIADYYATGARYNLSINSWTGTLNTTGVPQTFGHSVIWTGSEMIVWGGVLADQSTCVNTGARYNPSIDQWTEITTTNAPVSRSCRAAVWTGTEMIIWGGSDGGVYPINDGARYNPSLDTWTSVTTVGAPSGCGSHTAVWTGTEMIVWGGMAGPGDCRNDGARYNPSTDTWTPVTTVGAPSARWAHIAVWTGTEMIIWGGHDLNDGARYNPASDTWIAMTSIGAPPGGVQTYTPIWTGSKLIIWGGEAKYNILLNTGAVYAPNTNTWTPTSTYYAPSVRMNHSAVWTGTEMIIWGGSHSVYGSLNTGGSYTLE